MPYEWLRWVGENWGIVGLIVLILILNGEKIARGVAFLVPPINVWLTARAQARERKALAEKDEQEHRQQLEEVSLHHKMDSLAYGMARDAKREDLAFGIVDKMVDRQMQATEKTTKEIANLRERIWSLHSALIRYDDLMLVQAKSIDALTQEIADLRECVQVALEEVPRSRRHRATIEGAADG